MNGLAEPLGATVRELMREVGIHRFGLGFACLRHVFRTVADGSRDQVACNLIMGHNDPSMGAVYTEHIDDSRLVAVAECVRDWLFAKEGGK